MADLSVSYLGLKLKNPIIVGSSGLTASISALKKCRDAGAGAVVLKSLFEEALLRDNAGFDDLADEHPEALDYYYSDADLLLGANEYCNLIKEAKTELDIPVVASINCLSVNRWPDFTKQIAACGADAIELNVFEFSNDPFLTSEKIETKYYEIIRTVKSKTSIPTSIKISPYFTNLALLTDKLGKSGADGFVMFNKFANPDIDTKKISLTSEFNLTSPSDIYYALKWAGIISSNSSCDIAISGGVASGEDVVKSLLTGASAVQIVSEIYRSGFQTIKTMLTEVANWMDNAGFHSISEFKGRLNYKNSGVKENYLRNQFIENTSKFDN